jgi:hypothetical protein
MEQDSSDTTGRTKQLGQDRTARTGKPEKAVGIVKPGKEKRT